MKYADHIIVYVNEIMNYNLCMRKIIVILAKNCCELAKCVVYCFDIFLIF